MNEEEYAELLVYLQGHLAEAGRTDLHEIALSTAEAGDPPSTVFLSYLAMVRQQLTLESREAAAEAIGRLREFTRSEEPLEDVVILPLGWDGEHLWGQVSLADDLPSRAELLQTLDAFSSSIAQERGGQGRSL